MWNIYGRRGRNEVVRCARIHPMYIQVRVLKSDLMYIWVRDRTTSRPDIESLALGYRWEKKIIHHDIQVDQRLNSCHKQPCQTHQPRGLPNNTGSDNACLSLTHVQHNADIVLGKTPVDFGPEPAFLTRKMFQSAEICH